MGSGTIELIKGKWLTGATVWILSMYLQKGRPLRSIARFRPALTPCPTGSCARYRKTYPIIISGSDYYLPALYFYTTHSRWVLNNGFQGMVSCGRLSTEYPVLNFVIKHLSDSLWDMDTVLVHAGRVKMAKRLE